jgi:hypothetical protein
LEVEVEAEEDARGHLEVNVLSDGLDGGIRCTSSDMRHDSILKSSLMPQILHLLEK